uniref:Ribokinase-like domain-containing protein n=2 Tax=environmental samples TaxID=651140 RepID=A0A075H5E1_9ARCH|nr:ribokinase-like domain-containing protein [uncultured marine thaumarchaeote KM3_52_F05]AIF11568.1 ribokinase-like domain-containing protein [uncultured marine thaumarchaeote KM3_52_H04]
MELDIFSHCTIDTIQINDSKYVVPGGPACYCSLTARILKFDVRLHTKFGSDFPLVNYLTEQKIVFEDALSTKPTTQFILNLVNSERTLFLQNKCESINSVTLDTDTVIISPLFDEISIELFEKIKKNASFVLLDPQGFLRRKNSENKIYLEQVDLNLSNVSAIKVNPDELKCLTSASNIDGVKTLQKKGIDNVILTDKQNISLLSKNKIYSITLPNLELVDTTGIGDIFCAAFCCTMIREKDILWALSFAGGAVQAALESKQIGLEKIPPKGAIESNAYYFYNTIKFKGI